MSRHQAWTKHYTGTGIDPWVHNERVRKRKEFRRFVQDATAVFAQLRAGLLTVRQAALAAGVQLERTTRREGE
jgi:DNA phosphorothioation-dependent restriction protein DptG